MLHGLDGNHDGDSAHDNYDGIAKSDCQNLSVLWCISEIDGSATCL